MSRSIEHQVEVDTAEISEHLEALRRVVGDQRRTPDSRRAAAQEIVRLTAGNTQAGSRILTEPPIADDDPDVLELTKPRDIGTLNPSEYFHGPKSLHNAKTIVAGRRRRVLELRRVVDEALPASERLAAIEAILSTLKRLAPLDVLEDVTWDRIGGRSAEWLLANADVANQTPTDAKDIWPLGLLPHHW